jgi:polygalacturonase
MEAIMPRLHKSIIIALFILAGTAQGGGVIAEKPQNDYSFLYENLPFQMAKVKQPVIPAYSVSIRDFGAKSGGMISNTNAIASSINAVVNKGGGTVIIPEGLWLTGPIVLKSKVNLHAEKGALVLFTNNYDEYPLVKTWFEGESTWRAMSPIFAEKAEDIAITGEGIFDGNGGYWRPANKYSMTESKWKELTAKGGRISDDGMRWFPSEGALKGSMLMKKRGSLTEQEAQEIKVFLRPVMVGLVSCKRVRIDGPVFQNPPAWTLHPLMSEDVTIAHVKIFNEEWAANADALDLESCKNAIIYDCLFDAGDDAITMKSGRDEEGRKRGIPTENVIVSNCVVYSGHGGFVVGSEMSGGVRNIDVKHCTFIGTDNGLRFKSTRGRGGVVENIYISDINMINIRQDAILFDLYYMVRDKGKAAVPPVNELTPQFRNIFMKNIVCKGAKRAVLLQGLPEMMLKNISMENVSIEANTGIFLSDAEMIKMKNVHIQTPAQTAMEITNASKLEFDNFSFNEKAESAVQISGEKTEDVVFRNSKSVSGKIIISAEVKAGAVSFK